MQPEGSLPHSQVPASWPCPEPDQSSPFLPSHFLKIHFNIIVPSMPGSSKWSLSPKFPHQNSACTSLLPHICFMLHPSHTSLFYHLKNIGCAVQIIKLLIMKFSSLPCYLITPRPKYSPQHPQPAFLPQYERPVFISIKKQHAKSWFCIPYSFYFWQENWKTKYSAPNERSHSLKAVCS